MLFASFTIHIRGISMNKRRLITILTLIVIALNWGGCKAGLGPEKDLDTPEVSVTNYVNGNHVSGTITLEGIATDDTEVTKVVVTIDETEYPATLTGDNVKSLTWTLPVDTTVLEDGKKNILVTVTDKYDGKGTATVYLYIDNTDPVVLVTSPSLTSNELNGDVIIEGAAYDNLELSGVEISLKDSGGNYLIQDAATEGLYQWSYTINSLNLNGVILDGDYTIEIKAEDGAGNESTHFYHEDSLYSNLGVTLNLKELIVLENGGTVEGVTVTQGDLEEETIQLGSATYSIDQNSDYPVITLWDFPESGYKVVLPSSKIIGTVTDDDAVVSSSIQISVDGGTYETVTLTQIGTKEVNWEYSVSALSEGSHTIRVKASDNNIENPKISNTGEKSILIDVGPPTLSVDDSEELTGSYHNGNLILTGTTSDGSGISAVEVKVGDFEYITAGLTEVSSLNYTWNYEIDLDCNDDGDNLNDDETDDVENGEIVVVVRSTDVGGNQSTVSIPMVIDTEKPTLAATSPAFGTGHVSEVYQNGLVTITGTANDNTQLTKVDYVINPAGTPAEGDWTALATKYNWSVEDVNTEDYDDALGEGNFVLRVRATDLAGNKTETDYTVSINQSTDKPEISFSNIDDEASAASDNALDAGAVIIGTIKDDDAVDSSSIQIRIYDGSAGTWGAWEAVSDPPASDLAVVTFKHELPSGSYDEDVYRVQVRAYDIETSDYTSAFKAVESDEIPFVIDSGPPTLTVTSPETSTYHNGNFTIEGTAVDSLGVANVMIKINSGTPVAVTNLTGDYDTWEYNVDLTALGVSSGTLLVHLTTQDISGKQYYADLQYFIDTEPPEVDGDNITPAEGSEVNGTIVLKGTASDNNIVSGLGLYAVNPTGGTDIAIASDISGFDTGATVYSWKKTLVLSTYGNGTYGVRPASGYTEVATAGALPSPVSAEGTYCHITGDDTWRRSNGYEWVAADPWDVTFKLVAEDGADLFASTERTLRIDPVTDRPVVNITNMDITSGDLSDKLLELNPKILGTIEDDDGINTSVNSVQISINGGTATDLTSIGTGTITSFSYNLYDPGTGALLSGITEGENNFTLIVRDIVYGTSGATGYNETTIGPVTFAIDQQVPTITLSGGTYLENGDKINATGGTIRFTVADANDTALTAAVNGDPVTLTAGVGDYIIDPSDAGSPFYAEGEHIVTITGTDDFDKTSEKVITIIVDKTEPDISVNNLDASDILNGDGFTLRGSVDEDYGLSSVTLQIRYAGGAVVSGYDGVAVTGSYGWNYTIDMLEIYSGGNGTGLADGNYEVQITAEDEAGNSDVTGWIAFEVRQSEDLPSAEISSLTGEGADYQSGTITISQAAGNNILTGVITDSTAIDTTGGISGLTLTVDSDGAGGAAPVDITAEIKYQADDAEYIPFYVNMSDEVSYPDGTYDIELTLPGTMTGYYDIIGNNVNVLTNGNRIVGLAEDDDEMSGVLLTLNGADAVNQTGLTGTQYSLNYQVPSGLASGIYLAEFTGTDPNGLESTVRTLFIKDTASPSITVETPLLTASYVNSVHSTGTVTDDYALKSLGIGIYSTDSTLLLDIDPNLTKNSDIDWRWNANVETLPDSYASETVSLQFSALDFVGKEAKVERTLTLDNEEPIVAVSSPLATDKVNGAVTIYGSTTDAAVSTVELRIGKYEAGPTWVGTARIFLRKRPSAFPILPA